MRKFIMVLLLSAGTVFSDTLIDSESLLAGWTHPPVIFNPGEEYGSEARKYQGIPSVERAPGGRLWAAWYAGPIREDRYNYLLAATSADDGETWSDIQLVIDPDGDGPMRAADPCLWLDPSGKLWLFWWTNRELTMAITTDTPDAEHPVWTEPAPLFPGVMLNKPIVTSNGEWLMPASVRRQANSCRLMVSSDQGKTWALRGTANVPEARRECDEPMVVERRDGSLWMLVRTADYGIGDSVSTDGGRTWTEVQDYQKHTSSRFTLLKLKSGNLLLLRNGPVGQRIRREQMSAYLSDDDGATWKGGLVLDARVGVSYPDATQAPDGTIYAVYDWNREDDKNILMATFTEKDVLAGACVSGKARSRILINQATGINPKPWLNKTASFDLRANADGAPMLAGPRAAFILPNEKIRTVQEGEPVFSNRGYQFSSKIPNCLLGKQFVYSDLESSEAVCSRPGVIYVVTPSPGRNKDSLAGKLEEDGFVLVDVPEFLLFLLNGNPGPSRMCSVYQKQISKGDVISLGQWGVLIF
jgi:hypothetical protein